MISRRLLSVVAIVGMLLHAGLFVRHNAMMLGATLDHDNLGGIFSEICSAKLDASEGQAATHPQDRNETNSHCQDCLAFAGAVALLAIIAATYDATYSTTFDTRISSQVERRNILALWPPGQGPPVNV